MADTPRFLSYARQCIDSDDIAAVAAALQSDWLTTGPRVKQFEDEVAEFCGAKGAVAVSSGTAALHTALFGLGIGQGDEVIVPAMTFVASANCAAYLGARPVIVDVDADSLLISPKSVEANISKKTRAIVAVDYTGESCDYASLGELAERHGLPILSDSCHALGASFHSRPLGSVSDLTVFSFHPVKHITTMEGGMILSREGKYIDRMRSFRNHGNNSEVSERERVGTWYYEMQMLGFNYRLSDVQCALGISQLKKLPDWLENRRKLARLYTQRLTDVPGVIPLSTRAPSEHAYHLFVVRVKANEFGISRDDLYRRLREKGIGTNVHYMPIHLQPFYREQFGTRLGQCPNAEAAFSEILSLPLFNAMTESDVHRVVDAITEVKAF